MPDSNKKDDNLTPLLILGGITLLWVIGSNRKKKFTGDQISQFYTRADLEHSITATQTNTPNTAPPEVMQTAREFALNFLDPLTLALGYRPWTQYNSWYRSPELNSLITGSSSTSDHMTGGAIDLDSLTGKNPEILYTVLDLQLPFDQLIVYGDLLDPTHVHIGYRPGANRGQIFKKVGSDYVPLELSFLRDLYDL